MIQGSTRVEKTLMDKSALANKISGVAANVEKVIFGKHAEVELALVALVCRGHILVEDVPGTGKTVLAKAIARSLGVGCASSSPNSGQSSGGGTAGIGSWWSRPSSDTWKDADM